MTTDPTPTTTSPNPAHGGTDPPMQHRPSGQPMPTAGRSTPGPNWTGLSAVRDLVANHRLLALVAVLAVLAPLVVAAAQQNGLDGPSPATGHASVIAQGIVEFPQGEFVCRVVERVAQPLGVAAYEEQELGFVIATEGALLLADEVDGVQQQVARLAVGELYLVQDGTRQRRASAGADPVTYTVLEIVAANRAAQVGDGRLLLTSEAIPAPSGFRDLDLVQDVLALNEQSQVTESGAGMVILATDGAVEVVPRGGRPRTLQEGELGIFPEGVEVRSVAGTGASAKSSVATSLGHAFRKQSTPGGSSFLACVIGPEIPPLTAAPGIVPRTVPGPGNVPPQSEDDALADQGESEDPNVQEPEGPEEPPRPEPTPTLETSTTRDDITIEPTPTSRPGIVFQTPAVFVVAAPTPTPETRPEG